MADINDFHKQEHQKYLAMDEDELLQDLTEDELRQLNLHMDEIDPDVSRLSYAVKLNLVHFTVPACSLPISNDLLNLLLA